MHTAHRFHLVALVATAATISACSSSAGSSSGSGLGLSTGTTPGARSAAPHATAQPATSHRPGGSAAIRVTGGLSITSAGKGALCNYFYPSLKQGVAYSVSSAELGSGASSAGGWSLLISDDTGHHLSVVLNTDHGGSWTAGRSIVGTVHANADLHHADFDVQLVKVVGQQHAQLTGHIDCP